MTSFLFFKKMGWEEYCSNVDDTDSLVVTDTSISFHRGQQTFGLAIFDVATSSLKHIFVQPMRKGHGTWLLRLVEDEMRRRGCRHVQLYSVLDAFYERNGYQKTFLSRILGGSRYWKSLW